MKSKTTLVAAAAVILGVVGSTAAPAVTGAFGAGRAAAQAAPAADTTPPATPGHFRLEGRTGNQLQLNWDWTSDVGGYVTQYELSYAGRTVILDHYYPGDTRDVSDLNLSPGHSYTFSLRAIDQAGNRSQPTQLVFETTPPTSARNLRLVSSAPDGTPDIIHFDGASDNAGQIRAYEVILNGRSLRMMRGTGSEFSLREQIFYIAYTGAPKGPATLQLRAFDASLNPGPLSEPFTVVFP